MKKLLKKLRIYFLLNSKYKLISYGKNFYCGKNLFISKNFLQVNDNVYIGNHCHIAAKTLIDDYAMLASYVSIIGGDHAYNMVGTPMIKAGHSKLKQVVIQKDAWVGHGSIILHGVTVGEGSIVAAGSIITKNVLPYTIVGGNPAKFIRYRFNSKEDAKTHSKKINFGTIK